MRRAAVPALILLPLAWGASAATMPTKPQSAEQALSNYRKVFTTTKELDCPRSGSSDEIVVCGNREDGVRAGRLPLPVAREPGERIRGEPLADGGGCISRCHQPLIVPLHKIPGFIGKVIERLKDD
jgi:hypothetical protein